MLRLLLIFGMVWLMRAEIVDRIAIVIGQQVITEQQIDEEIRITALLNRQPVLRDLPTRRAAAGRLVEQLLVRRDVELSHYPAPSSQEIERYFGQIRDTFGSSADFAAALSTYNLTEAVLKEHLALQLTTLQFIEYRFRPDISISEADIENYYQRELEAWNATHPSAQPPTLAASRASIKQALMEQRTDETLDNWLQEARRQVNIVYLDKALQ